MFGPPRVSTLSTPAILRGVTAVLLAVMSALAVAPAWAAQGLPRGLVGDWCLIRMDVPIFRDVTFRGWMRIDPPAADGPATGELFTEALEDGSFGLQALVLEAHDDGRVIATGTLIEQENWVADTLTMALDDRGQLVGQGIDLNGTTFSYVFRRGRCEPTTS